MTTNRSLLFTIIGLLFAVLFIPLFVNNGLFFPFITGKNFAFRIIVELTALFWVILMLRDKTYRPKFSWLSIAIVAFVAVVTVADIFSSNPVKSLLSNFERMEGWITLAHLLLYYFIAVSVFKNWSIWKIFFQVSVGVSAIVCFQGFAQLINGAAQNDQRIYASFGNATYLAIYMLFHVFITIILLNRRLTGYDKKNKSVWDADVWYQDFAVYIYAIMIILQTTVLFFTATRGSILGLIGGFIMTAILVAILERKNKRLREVSIGLIIAIVCLVGVFLSIKDTGFVRNNLTLGRIASISATDNTTKSRFMIWNMAWHGVTQDPKHFIIGWGQESFNYIFNKYYDPGMYAQEQWFDRSHNVIFDWLTASGVLGLLSYLSIYVLMLYTLWKKTDFSCLEKSLITGMIAGYFFHNIFVFDNIFSYILFFTMLAYVDVFAKKEDAVQKAKKHSKDQSGDISESFEYAGIILVCIIFVGVFYQFDYKPIATNLALIRALTQRQIVSDSPTPVYVYTLENINDFREALSYNSVGLYETREQLMDIAQKSINSKSEDSIKQGLVSLAQSEVLKQLEETPNDVRYYVLGGNFFQGVGDYKDSLTLLKKASDLSPKKQSILFNLGSDYFALKQYSDATSTFKKAYELDTSYDEAKKLYGLVSFYLGQNKVVEDLFGKGPVMDARFLLAYKNAKNYDLMVAYLEKSLASQNPKDIQGQIQAKLSLADGYITAGDSSKAISVLQSIKVLADNPSAQTEIDSLIKAVKAGKNPWFYNY